MGEKSGIGHLGARLACLVVKKEGEDGRRC